MPATGLSDRPGTAKNGGNEDADQRYTFSPEVLVAMIGDFVLFGIIRHQVNDNGTADADFGAGLWCLAAAFVTLFLGMVIVFFTCCASRREKRRPRQDYPRSDYPRHDYGTEKEAPRRRKKKFGIF